MTDRLRSLSARAGGVHCDLCGLPGRVYYGDSATNELAEVMVNNADLICDVLDAARLSHKPMTNGCCCGASPCRVTAALDRLDQSLNPDTKKGAEK